MVEGCFGKAEPHEACGIVGGGFARVRQDDDPLARGSDTLQRIHRAGIWHPTVMQGAILVEEENIEGLDEVRELRIHIRCHFATAFHASRAVPTAASVEAAGRKGTPSFLWRMRVHAAFTAPPPTLRTDFNAGAPSCLSRR